MKLAIIGAAVTAAVLAFGAPARAQGSYPSAASTIVTPLAPGTTIDVLARLYADKLSKRFGQQVIVSNRPGAGGLIAAQAVAAAPADGYTVLLANSGHAILGTLNKNLPFDPVRDFAGVSLIGETAALVTVPPSLGLRSLQAFVDLAKAKPGTVNYASAGIGTATHLAGAYFAKQAGIQMVHVPYKTGSALSPICWRGACRLRSRRPPSRCRCCRRANCWRSRCRRRTRCASPSRCRAHDRPASITNMRPGTASLPR
jgi:tripartite-type tricarboxylate transporter receptor subunit TctC